jgi:hypothetical protein
MGIPGGSVLQSTRDESSVIVVGPKRVKFGEEELSLTAATRQVPGTDYSVAPGPFWTFNGKRISDIYEETYGDVD